MEYRRRRSGRRRPQGQGGGAAKAVVALMVVAVLVYLVSASAVGTWIAENVFAPAFATIDGWIQGTPKTPLPDTTGVTGGSPTAQPSVSLGNPVTGEVQLPAMECYALQMGVYGDEKNAETQAALLKERGAGGYVMEDQGRYRVLAAAYLEQASLKQVRDQLTGEGLESAAYVFSAPNSTLRVTAAQEQLDGLNAGFAALTKLQKDMADVSLAFDQQQQSVETGRAAVSSLLNELREAKDAFSLVASEENPVLQATRDCFSAYETALNDLAGDGSQSFVDFSSKMKYTHICMVHAYATLAQKISSM